MGLKIKKSTVAASAAPQVVAGQEDIPAPGTAVVTKHHPDGSVEENVSKAPGAEQAADVEAPAYVSVGFGVTRNTGNYESIRFYVGVTVPCENTDAAKGEAYEEIRKWVDDKVNGLNEEITEAIGG